MLDLIYQFAPKEAPILRKDAKVSRRLLVKQFGQSTRARKRRLMKPLKMGIFKISLHEWR